MKKLFNRFYYYFGIWWLMSKNSFLMVSHQRLSFAIFLLGKVLRFGLFFLFLFFLLKGTDSLAGYNINETLLFFLTFSLIDVVSQFFFREVYRFRPQIVSGSFDMTLAKPISSLFRALLGGADVIDLVTIPPLVLATIWIGNSLSPGFINLFFYLTLFLNGLVISAAFHIAVLSLGIITLEIDHTILIYRDLVKLGLAPIEIYREPLRGFLTYLIPVAIMVSLPAKALIGIISPLGVIGSFAIGASTLFVSLKLWKFALAKYTSASN